MNRIIQSQVVSCDVDDILFPFYVLLNQRIAEARGVEIRPENLTSYNLHDIWQISKEEVDKFVIDCHRDYSYGYYPLPFSQEATYILSRTRQLIVVTSRQDCLKNQTFEVIKRFFTHSFKPENIFFADRSKKGRKKSEICLDKKVDIHIEDCLDVALECDSVGINVLLMDYPWNKCDKLPPLIKRVKHWGEILELFGYKDFTT